MKVTFITTIFNEEKTIVKFLESLNAQTKQPDEIIIIDGGSTDKTVEKIAAFQFAIAKKKVIVKVKSGNRSVGRNEAITMSKNEIIVCSDAGNILDKDWIKNIVAPFTNKKVDVVAGYYKGIPTSIFQKSLIPYALVMPNKIDAQAFLPATRSIAFKKSVWQSIGKFDEKLSHNEDYVFAKKLKQSKYRIEFAKDALVYWFPRESYTDAFIMFYRFAYGDAEAGIFRPKVIFLLLRYLIGINVLVYALVTQNTDILLGLTLLLTLYIVWAILKNYAYVRHWQALYILPILQFTADFAVIKGTVHGLLRTTPR